MNKKWLGTVGFIAVGIMVIMIAYTNCGKKAGMNFSSMQNANQILGGEEKFLVDLSEYEQLVSKLRNTGKPEAKNTGDELADQLAKVKKMISKDGDNLPYHDTRVLWEKGRLDNIASRGRDLIITISLDQAIADSIARDNALEKKLNDLDARLSNELNNTRSLLEKKIADLDAKLSSTAADLRAEIQKQKDATAAELAVVKKQIASLEIRVTENARDISGMKLDISRMQTSLQQLKAEMAGAVQALAAAMDAGDQALARQIQEEQDLRKDAISKLQKQITDSNTQLSREVARLDSRDAYLYQLIVSLKTQVDSNAQSIAGLQQQVMDTTARIEKAIRDGDQALARQLELEKQERLAAISALQSSQASLTSELSTLRTQHQDLANSFTSFQAQINTRIQAVESRVSSLESRMATFYDLQKVIQSRIDSLNSTVKNLQDTTAIALASINAELSSMKIDTQKQILELKNLSADLKQKISTQENLLSDLLASQQSVTNLQAKMCTAGDQRTACTGAEAQTGGAANCCLTLSTLNCSQMFPGATEIVSKNQCEILVSVLKNHDEQLKAITEVDQKQTQLIDGLLSDVKNLNSSVNQLTESIEILSQGMADLKSTMGNVLTALSAIDARLLIVEFKAARQEAAAALQERNDLTMAWITRRMADVRDRYCYSNSQAAYGRSDYDVAKQNWVYCNERLSYLNQAKEMVLIASAAINGMASLNVDQSCSATIAGKSAESLSNADLLQPAVYAELLQKCQAGASLVKGKILNIIALQKRIAPDFRTAAYMMKKAKIAQVMYFNSEVAQAPRSVLEDFENIDPTSASLKDTFYGLVEGPFKKIYPVARLRDSQGNFIEDLAKLPDVTGFSEIYGHDEVSQGATAYLARLRSQEIGGSCANCGYQVVGRNMVDRAGKKKYSFPKDAQTKCPVQDDVVMTKGSDGKFYAYRLSYSAAEGATEYISAYWADANGHYPVAQSAADVAAGNTTFCGYPIAQQRVNRFGMPDTVLLGRLVLEAVRPYDRTHGLPQCQRFQFTCGAKVGEWSYKAGQSPTNNIMNYLNGFDDSQITPFCKQSGRDFIASSRKMSEGEKQLLWAFNGPQDAGSVAVVNSISDQTTQLTSKYWMYAYNPVTYGRGDLPSSKANPFYAATTCNANPFFRVLHQATPYDITVQQCYDNGSPE